MSSVPTFESKLGALPSIPTNLTIPQFILDSHHPSRPPRPADAPWLIHDKTGDKIHLNEIRVRVSALANGLHTKLGISNNDVVVLFSPNHVDWPICLWAIHRLGAVASPANPAYTPSELLHQLTLTNAKAIIVHPNNVATVTEAAKMYGKLTPERILVLGESGTEKLIAHGKSIPKSYQEPVLKEGEARTKLAVLSFSSGTTGKPKAVAIPHYAFIANVIQAAAHNAVNTKAGKCKPGDVAIAVLPFYHIYGLVLNMHFLFFSGLTIVPIEKFNFEEMLKSITRHKITHLLHHPLARNHDLSSVKWIMTGAAPLTEELNAQLVERFPQASVGQGYGMTESSTVVSMFSPHRPQGIPGSSGTIVPGVQMRILKEDGTYGGYGDVGELILKSPSLALGYYGNEQATKETFVDGWLRTGDQARIDTDHEVWIVDRLKEIMKVKGFQVAPAELEGCLLDHKDVADVCVVGIPDDYSGELPLAFVLPTVNAQKLMKSSSHAAQEIANDIKKHIAVNKVAYKHLSEVHFVDEIPKNPSGKLLRRILRDKARALVESRKRSSQPLAKL
ncbi:phenylacetyl-CoA ligase [Flagelloscypha sp. PMI_526]|nr:phenylacetyl-CoA ligase [Flagelloscypha sp. PMI_526]